MELTDIMALVKAGYTKDEIAQMEQTPSAVTDPEPVQLSMDLPEPSAEPKPVQAQVAEPVAVAQPVPQPVQQDQPTMAQLMESIAKLTSAVQANAIAQSVMPTGVAGKVPTAEDMLAEIIRPTFQKRSD